jgi:hypothetical protein
VYGEFPQAHQADDLLLAIAALHVCEVSQDSGAPTACPSARAGVRHAATPPHEPRVSISSSRVSPDRAVCGASAGGMSDASVADQRCGPAPGSPERRHRGLRDRTRSMRSRVGVRHRRGRPDLSGSRPVRQRASPQRADRPGDPGVPGGDRRSTGRGLRRQATPRELSSAVDAFTHVRLSSGGPLSRYLAAVLHRGGLQRVTTTDRRNGTASSRLNPLRPSVRPAAPARLRRAATSD